LLINFGLIALIGKFLDEFLGKLLWSVKRDAEAEAEFRLVFEQRIIPRQAASALFGRPLIASLGDGRRVRDRIDGHGLVQPVSDVGRRLASINRFACRRFFYGTSD
jgi:hypothetical protein